MAKRPFQAFPFKTAFFKRAKRVCLIAATASAACTAPLHAQQVERNIDPTAYQQTVANMDWIMEEFQKATGLPGLSFSLGYGGDVVLSKGYGLTNIDSKVPVKPSSRFRYSDTSTLFTATAIMKLAERGKINLDADISTYVPAYPKKRFSMTVRQLLSHTAGMPHFDFNDYNRGKNHVKTLTKALDQFSNRPLKQAPGTSYQFSAFGYVLLGLAIEKVSGQSYDDFIKTEVLSPSGLTGVHFDNMDDHPTEETTFYNRFQNTANLAAVRDFSYVKPAAGINGTPADIVKLLSDYWRGVVIPPMSFADMLQPVSVKEKADPMDSYAAGMGWLLSKDQHGDTVYYMTGKDVGATAAYISDPRYGLHLAYLGNARVETHARQTLKSLLMPLKSLLAHSDSLPPSELTCPTGTYDYRGQYENEFTKGNMIILQSGSRCSGVIQTPSKFISYFLDEGAPTPENLSMILLTREGNDLVFGIITPLGIFPVQMTLSDNRLKGDMVIEDQNQTWSISASLKP